jgi:hypothetical protein
LITGSSVTMAGFDGHEVAFLSTIGGAMLLIDRTMPKGWVRGFVHRQPVAAMASFWVLAGITLPLVVPPLRRAMQFPSNQYDAAHAGVVTPKY